MGVGGTSLGCQLVEGLARQRPVLQLLADLAVDLLDALGILRPRPQVDLVHDVVEDLALPLPLGVLRSPPV
eukprot:428245-Alexandrium_andersonii.AAC.1